MQRPGDDDVVEEAHVQRDEDDREAHAWRATARLSVVPPATSGAGRALASTVPGDT